MQIITLTTDFGTQDWFVGTMKGIILAINPRAAIVDITHEIPPSDIRAGAFALAAGYGFFPKGAVHLVVVDPGVGSRQKAIAVQTTNYFFVGPDNGVLSFALQREEIKSVRRIDNEKFLLHPISHTFHGRDIFAPVAAHLSRGVRVGKLGPAQKDFVRLAWPKPRVRRDRLEGEIVYLDRFGNAITDIENASLSWLKECHVLFGRKRSCPLKEFYQSVRQGQPVAVPGASGFLEIAVNQGSAVKKFGLRIGDAVIVRLSWNDSSKKGERDRPGRCSRRLADR